MNEAYSIYDSKTQTFSTPIFVSTSAAAIRVMLSEIRQPDSYISQYPADFTLYRVGGFDKTTGEFISQKPVQILTGFEAMIIHRKIEEKQTEMFKEAKNA